MTGCCREQTPQNWRQRYRQTRQRYPRDHVDDVVIPEIDRRYDQSRHQRNQSRKKFFLPFFPCVKEGHERNGCVAAREGIGLVFFKGVQRSLNLFDEWVNLQALGLEMVERKAGPD